MTVVSSREFVINQKKYFDIAEKENICITRGNNRFHLVYQSAQAQYPEQVILNPDDNLRNAITAKELLERVNEDIHNKFASRI
jgi:hypothetical protein